MTFYMAFWAKNPNFHSINEETEAMSTFNPDIQTLKNNLARWKARHSLVTWVGIVLNLVLAIPFFFAPEWAMEVLKIPSVDPIWPRVGAMLLIIITTFYIPMTIDIDRYRPFCWLSILPSRTFGGLYFLTAVVAFGYSPGFLAMALLDIIIAIVWLFCMIRIVSLENSIFAHGAHT